MSFCPACGVIVPTSERNVRRAPEIERILLRRVSSTFGFAEVRLPGVNLRDMRVQQRPDGQLAIREPERADEQGRVWPAYSLQPLWREAVEGGIGRLWAEVQA